MQQDAQKPKRKFCGHKTPEKRKTHPEKPEKGETGCVLGAGEGCSGWRRMKPGEKTQDRLEKGGNSSIAWRKWRDGLELASQALLRCPALSAAAGPPCQSPTAAPSPPRCICHRRRFGGDARHAPRAEASPPVTTKKERQADACLSFLAGAERLGLGCRLGRLVACVPPARTRPTTRTARGAAVPRCRVFPHTNEKVRCRRSDT